MIKNPDFMVSVCMITYNHESYIQQAIESILQQKCAFDFELVIGEDMSSDQTLSICKKYAETDGRIKLLSSSYNLGMIPNFVRTLKACTGKYIALCEGDDYWTDTEKLQKQVEYLELNTGYSMCFTNRSIVDSENGSVNDSAIPSRLRRELDAHTVLSGFTPPLQTVIFRNILLQRSPEILENILGVYNGDTFLFSYLSTFGPVGYLDINSAAYRVNQNGAYTSLDYQDRLERRMKTYCTLKLCLPEKYKNDVTKGLKIILQRLFAISCRQCKIIPSVKYFSHLIILDLKTVDVSTFKAIKLFFKAVFKRGYVITD